MNLDGVRRVGRRFEMGTLLIEGTERGGHWYCTGRNRSGIVRINGIFVD